eukprot:TRINITY_DN5880_c0_g1_i11.p2 TRINITY_DN5880_c0_g1~~TRINITY_DN5880_c0_g1_i11.p2  ORF type:complete len:133 (+),score=30.33 TRINITY_DN5880_c0_g1_i11:91-489(+)
MQTHTFFFSSRRRHTRQESVSWARRCVQETATKLFLGDMRNHDDVLLNQFIDKLGREDYDFKIDPEVEWELYKRNIEYITRDLDTVHPVRTIAPFDPSREQRLMNRTRKPYPKMKREPAHATFDPDNSILDQ